MFHNRLKLEKNSAILGKLQHFPKRGKFREINFTKNFVRLILHYFFPFFRTLWFLKRNVIQWTTRNGVSVLYLNKIHLHHILASGEKNTQSKSLNSAERYPKKLHYAKPHYTSLVSQYKLSEKPHQSKSAPCKDAMQYKDFLYF